MVRLSSLVETEFGALQLIGRNQSCASSWILSSLGLNRSIVLQTAM